MVILLTARRWRQDYEWWHARGAGARRLACREPLSTPSGPGPLPAAPSPDEALIFELCEVLFADGRVPDALYARAVAVLGEPGLVDVVCAVGYYSTLALIMNATRTALPEGASAPHWG